MRRLIQIVRIQRSGLRNSSLRKRRMYRQVDTDAGVFFFIMILLVSLLILGGILITRTRKKKQNKNGPKLLAG